MPRTTHDVRQGLDTLRDAVVRALLSSHCGPPLIAAAGVGGLDQSVDPSTGWLHSEASHTTAAGRSAESVGTADSGMPLGYGDGALAASSEDSEAERSRLIALVELARAGDKDAFGLLFDHYHPSVYRFLYYRTRSVVLAEDLTSETFVRALRNMANFRWQGKDFGAWLMTIARNLATDHFKAGRTRLEMVTEDMGAHDAVTEGPESEVLTSLTHEILLRALTELPGEQKDCLVMRFLQGMSIAETAAVLGRSDGAVKQLQLRGIRNLAKLVPQGIR